MRVLIVGGDGMLGHELFNHFVKHHDTRVTLHRELAAYEQFRLFTNGNAYAGIDVRFDPPLLEVLAAFQPQAVINAVGIVKQREAAHEYIPSIEINALLPHRLALLCRAIGARLVHVSTDCVFSGKKGNYRDDAPSDAEDLYGKSKFLGEVRDTHAITLRTSMIGPELARKTSLLEWFLAQRGTVNGFTKAIFSGFSTMELARIIETVLEFPAASGVYNVSSEPISKHDLLVLIKEKMRLPIEIVPDGAFQCDRSLDSTCFRAEFHYTPPVWEAMIDELARELKRTIA
jgi:dTDP-4-dehydrorhamnose reductase